MITQLWGLSKRTLSKKGNLAALLHMEPSKFLAEFRSSAKKGTLRFPNTRNLLNSLRNLEVAQKREPCGSLFCLVVDQFVFAVPAVEFADFFANLFRRMLSCELSHRFEVPDGLRGSCQAGTLLQKYHPGYRTGSSSLLSWYLR